MAQIQHQVPGHSLACQAALAIETGTQCSHKRADRGEGARSPVEPTELPGADGRAEGSRVMLDGRNSQQMEPLLAPRVAAQSLARVKAACNCIHTSVGAG